MRTLATGLALLGLLGAAGWTATQVFGPDRDLMRLAEGGPPGSDPQALRAVLAGAGLTVLEYSEGRRRQGDRVYPLAERMVGGFAEARPDCPETECRSFMAFGAQEAPLFGPHHYRLLWVERDGAVGLIRANHDPWSGLPF